MASASASSTASSFESLPDEIIERILWLADPDVFASLVLLDRRWRRLSQTAELYHHQLAKCLPSQTTHVSSKTDLQRLKYEFASVVKRHAYPAYLRPAQTLVKFVSTAATSSIAFPRGEALQFSISRQGHWIVAVSSTRIYIISSQTLPEANIKAFRTSRKPLRVVVLEDGTGMAVLVSEYRVNLYEFHGVDRVKLVRSIALMREPYNMTLSADDQRLITVYPGGMEIISISARSPPISRMIRCPEAEDVICSPDDRTIIATTRNNLTPSTTIVSVDVEDDADDGLHNAWISGILSPKTYALSHAVPLQSNYAGDNGQAIVWSPTTDAPGIIDLNELRFLRTHFKMPRSAIRPAGDRINTLPAVNEEGQLLAVQMDLLEHHSVLIYGIPVELEKPTAHGNHPYNSLSALQRSRSDRTSCGPYRNPEDPPHVIVQGVKLRCDEDIVELHWAAMKPYEGNARTSLDERLIAISVTTTESTDMSPTADPFEETECGRLTLFDFSYSPYNGKKSNITIDLDLCPTQLLPDEEQDMAREVDLQRRRTVAQRRDGAPPARAATVMNRAGTVRARTRPVDVAPLPSSRAAPAPAPAEEDEMVEAPYVQGQPRTAPSLHRAATVANVSDFNRRHLRSLPDLPLQTQGPGGLRAIVEGGYAEPWEEPPPAYERYGDAVPPGLVLRRLASLPTPEPPVPDVIGAQHVVAGRQSVERRSRRPPQPSLYIPERPAVVPVVSPPERQRSMWSWGGREKEERKKGARCVVM